MHREAVLVIVSGVASEWTVRTHARRVSVAGTPTLLSSLLSRVRRSRHTPSGIFVRLRHRP